MISSLDNNLFLQVIIVLPCVFIFSIILEGFGFALLKILSPIFRRFDTSVPATNSTIRIFLGGLFYTLVFFILGLVGLLTKSSVLGVSALVPILGFVLGHRWRDLHRDNVASVIDSNKYIILGSVAFAMMTFIFWFRPITNFDAIWYHLTIPKLFLQNHDIRNQGGLLLYSLQPSMNYFWNLWPLSLPMSTAVASIVINGIQVLLVCMSLGFVTSIGKKLWGWNRFHQFAIPIVLGFSFEGVSLLGIGGNDLVGLAYGLVATMYCFYLLSKSRVTWGQLTLGILLIVGLATIKVFYTLFAGLVMVYFLVGAWNKLPTARDSKKQFLKLSCLLAIIFAVTYLPWLLRAYLATGRPLDPLGIPGINAQFYINQGGGTALNHWSNFIFTRFYASIGPMLFFIYSPLVLVGVLSVFNRSIRAKITNLWLLSLASFWVIFFASITIAWRYYLPQAILLSFLGIVALIVAEKKLDIFGKLVMWTVLGALVFTTGLRVLYTSSTTAANTVTDASIQGKPYIRHFSGINSYINYKVITEYKDYSYVQRGSPEGLTPTEKILIGNTYDPIPLLTQPVSDYDLRNIHNLAYINNPILESTMDPKTFQGIENVDQFKNMLHSKKIRYIVSRKSMIELCKFVGVRNPKTCDDPDIFKMVLSDDAWNVKWYMLVDSKNEEK